MLGFHQEIYPLFQRNLSGTSVESRWIFGGIPMASMLLYVLLKYHCNYSTGITWNCTGQFSHIFLLELEDTPVEFRGFVLENFVSVCN